MSDDRLGSWRPTTVEERLDRMESYAAIQQLASRYARALDARDMDTVVSLFAPDVQVGVDQRGRAPLKLWMSKLMSQMRTSVHLVANHVIDFDDADHATGVVYCRDELERPELGEWLVGTIQYWDDYVRVGGEWCFDRRRLHRWYLVDALHRPAPGLGVNKFDEQIRERLLPDAYPTWFEFWDTRGEVDDGP
ncbi:MAG: nuclear transport factor 2 family protein [Acidimicrobiales bacterium]